MKKLKKVLCVVSCMVMLFCMAACGGQTADGKTISVNQLTQKAVCTNVDYYDFYNNTYIGGFSGTVQPLSGFSSVEIIFLDPNGTTRILVVDTPLSQLPSTVNVYTNYYKTTYDTYTCTYV